MAAADDIIAYDMMEEILIRLDVEDVMRCKSVCKSWHSLISAPYFVESHLKHNNNNDRELNYKRITGMNLDSGFLVENMLFVVGSSNGLVCVSPKGFEFLIVNPCTRQTVKILQSPPEPLPESDQRWDVVWGFGYDSSNNDYKILAGLGTETETFSTRFYVLSLKTCVWKFIQEIDYAPYGVSGVLCDGALHWLSINWQTRELAILSFDLSREEFIKIQLPEDHSLREYGIFYTLGVMEESLWLYESGYKSLSTKIWVLRRDNSVKQSSWVLLPHNYVMNYEAVYHMDEDDYSIGDTPHALSNSGEYMAAPIYVPSLVSPHVILASSSKSGSNDVLGEKWHSKEECSS